MATLPPEVVEATEAVEATIVIDGLLNNPSYYDVEISNTAIDAVLDNNRDASDKANVCVNAIVSGATSYTKSDIRTKYGLSLLINTHLSINSVPFTEKGTRYILKRVSEKLGNLSGFSVRELIKIRKLSNLFTLEQVEDSKLGGSLLLELTASVHAKTFLEWWNYSLLYGDADSSITTKELRRLIKEYDSENNFDDILADIKEERNKAKDSISNADLGIADTGSTDTDSDTTADSDTDLDLERLILEAPEDIQEHIYNLLYLKFNK